MPASKTTETRDSKRTRVSQSDIPSMNLEHALKVAQCIWDNFAGDGTTPMQLASALGIKPSSSGFRMLCGASIAYGLTEGGYNAERIKLQPLGLKIVRPVEEGEALRATRDAALRPRILAEFFEKYDKRKLPTPQIAQNILIDMGIPKDRTETVLEIMEQNAEFAQLIVNIKGDRYVELNFSSEATQQREKLERDDSLDKETAENEHAEIGKILFENSIDPRGKNTPELPTKEVRRVFITHGKNQKILEQIKKIVTYGGFDPIIAKDNETSAKPVPDKVLDDMRSCQAAVIHVGSEGTFRDEHDNLHPQINGNVLIEIGIARALYNFSFILLVEDGLKLPSNLQGMYECRYSGEELNMEATMKILEAFNEFKKG